MRIIIGHNDDDNNVEDMRKIDERFLHLQELIDYKRNILLKKQSRLHAISTENNFLEDVKDDYSKYYNYIIKQKQDQITALSVLDKYIKDLTESNNLSKQNIEDANYEQKRILSEIDKIKNNLDSIVNNLPDTSSRV